MVNTLVANAVGVLQIGGVSKGKSACVGGGKGAVVLALAAAASVLGGACLSLFCCDGPVDCHQQAFVMVLVGGLCFGFVEGEVGWFGGRKGFGIVESGSLSSE